MSRDTRQLIIDALLRLAQRSPEKTTFTLTEIAAEAHISRQAIYQKHFQNVDDIIKDMHLQIATKARKKYVHTAPTPGVSPFQILADEMIPILYEHRDWLRIIYTSSLYIGWMKHIENSYRQWLRPYIAEAYIDLEVDFDLILQLLIGFVFSSSMAWLSQPFPLPPEIFKETFLKIVKLSPNDFIGKQYRL
jgi:AcrR family transcriptional regulator